MIPDPRFRAVVTIPGIVAGTVITWTAAPGAVSYGIFTGSRDAQAEYLLHMRRQRKVAHRRKAQRRARTGRRI